ncbi:hypothetical protein [Bifidobacterium bifidum]|uniref:hypothetical protein n=1 Tax=Bifidobacterium bifidum TaxID=1681 RepID=UPI0002E9593E
MSGSPRTGEAGSAPRLEPAFREAGPAARAPRRSGGDGRPAAAHAADSRFPHDARHQAAADPGRIPTLKRSLNSSTYATINAVPGRAVPREKADAVVNISFARLNHPTTLVIIQQRESAPDSADQFHCLATPTHSFTVRTM